MLLVPVQYISRVYSVETHRPDHMAMTSTTIPKLRRIQKKVGCSVAMSVIIPSDIPDARPGFASAGWTYTLIAALGVVGFYKFAPSPEEDNYVIRYISYHFTPSGSWASTNERHLEMTTSLQEAVQLSQSGQRPHVHRYRYPQCVLFSLFLHDSAC